METIPEYNLNKIPSSWKINRCLPHFPSLRICEICQVRTSFHIPFHKISFIFPQSYQRQRLEPCQGTLLLVVVVVVVVVDINSQRLHSVSCLTLISCIFFKLITKSKKTLLNVKCCHCHCSCPCPCLLLFCISLCEFFFGQRKGRWMARVEEAKKMRMVKVTPRVPSTLIEDPQSSTLSVGLPQDKILNVNVNLYGKTV